MQSTGKVLPVLRIPSDLLGGCLLRPLKIHAISPGTLSQKMSEMSSVFSPKPTGKVPPRPFQAGLDEKMDDISDYCKKFTDMFAVITETDCLNDDYLIMEGI